MLKFKLIKKGYPKNTNSPKKYYATHVKTGTRKLHNIVKDVSVNPSINQKEIRQIIKQVTEIIPDYLLNGESVRLGDLGTIRLSFNSEGVDQAKDFSPDMIKNIKVIFTPSPKFKERIAEVEIVEGEYK
jgi:predicted histone-like DNA-binding protein